ncbi:nucleosome binding protein, partial [Powellomyces hirtus]
QPKEKVAKKSKPSSNKPPPKKKSKTDGPKRGLSAYLFFSNDKRSDVLAENPGMAVPEVSKKLGELWKAISAEDKAKYEEMATEDKQRYEREKADHHASGASKVEDATSAKPRTKKASGEEPAKYKSAEFVDTDSE